MIFYIFKYNFKIIVKISKEYILFKLISNFKINLNVIILLLHYKRINSNNKSLLGTNWNNQIFGALGKMLGKISMKSFKEKFWIWEFID